MNETTLTRIIRIHTEFDSIEAYKEYLHQLETDHNESGTIETAKDYKDFLEIINAFERNIVIP